MSNQLASYLEVISAAKSRTHFEDFKAGGRLSGDIRNGYQARMVAFSDLVNQGFVKLEAGLLVLGALSPVDWLTNGMLSGDQDSWKICDLYPSQSRKFKPDLLNLEKIGKEGEDYVISWLKLNLTPKFQSKIVHTSLTNDNAGYDIVSPSLKLPGRVFLEIKTSTRLDDYFTFHLSRNEWNTALGNPNWYLVLVNKIQGNFSFFGYLNSKSLVNYYPQDKHNDFQWSSVVGKLGPDDVFIGFPGF